MSILGGVTEEGYPIVSIMHLQAEEPRLRDHLTHNALEFHWFTYVVLVKYLQFIFLTV